MAAAPWRTWGSLGFSAIVGAWLVAGTSGIVRRVEDAAVAASMAADRLIAARNLGAIASGIAETKAALSRARAGREALAARLDGLEALQEETTGRAERLQGFLRRIEHLMAELPEGDDRASLATEAASRRRQLAEVERLIEWLDAASADVSRALAGAALGIEEAEVRLRVGEVLLATLRATNQARDLEQSVEMPALPQVDTQHGVPRLRVIDDERLTRQP